MKNQIWWIFVTLLTCFSAEALAIPTQVRPPVILPSLQATLTADEITPQAPALKVAIIRNIRIELNQPYNDSSVLYVPVNNQNLIGVCVAFGFKFALSSNTIYDCHKADIDLSGNVALQALREPGVNYDGNPSDCPDIRDIVCSK